MNTFGNNLKITIFGQSHAKAIGVTIDGLPSGIEINEEYIQSVLDLRAPGKSDVSTKRKEPDKVEFVSGVVNGKTCGTSLTAVIFNNDTHSSDYSNLVNKPRPSHADFPAMVKYGENYDIRGGGQFSGRLTAPICIAGAIALDILKGYGINIACHIASVGCVYDDLFDVLDDQNDVLNKLNSMPFAVINEDVEQDMKNVIKLAASDGDSVGGTIECKITGLPVGLGMPMFDGLEGVISRCVFAVPAIKGIEFGAGFEGSTLLGSQYNDAYFFADDGNIRTKTNNAGGICGGMSTGMPLVFKVAVKPTPSISKVQDTVDLEAKENVSLQIKGRHDPCIVPRANVVVRCAVAIALLDILMSDEKI